jgi:hypothetical protein
MEAVRKFKANPKMEGHPCKWCQIPLRLGDDAAVCNSCQGEHHGQCWDNKGGCATQGCVNAPLPQMQQQQQPMYGGGGYGAPQPGYGAAPQVSQQAALAAQGLMACPRCGSAIPIGSQICMNCKHITSPDGIYHGPKTTAPGATASLVFGLLGLLICGVIFGPIAISKANAAKAAIKMDPTLGGEGLATAGMVLGIIDIVGAVILLLARVGGS